MRCMMRMRSVRYKKYARDIFKKNRIIYKNLLRCIDFLNFDSAYASLMIHKLMPQINNFVEVGRREGKVYYCFFFRKNKK